MIKRSIILADDHVLLRQGLRKILDGQSDLEIAGEAGTGPELLELLHKCSPDLILLDISMPNMRGIEAIPEIRRIQPDVKILILTMHKEEEYMYEAISAGANGYMLKEDADKDLFFAIERVLEGKIYISRFLAEKSRQDWAMIRSGKKASPSAEPLTTREREVLKLIAEGKSSKEIGEMLYISPRTVERHRANMMEKLSAKNMVDLVKYAVRKGYIT
jgi:DNA-binding NarL/FixJ family response regulator